MITARAGTRLADIEQALRASGQMLACEPPHFGAGATLGGASPPDCRDRAARMRGAMRDIVLGVRMLDGRGEDLTFGGRVMKNVAGFDLARLMTGALGTLGVLTEISLKCVPLPKVEATRVLRMLGRRCDPDERMERQAAAGLGDLPSRGPLAVRLSGAVPAVAAAASKLGGEHAMPSGEAFWEGIREQTHPFFAAARAAGAPLWRLSVKATAPYADLGGEQMIEWSGALRWLVAGERTDPAKVRAWAREQRRPRDAVSRRGQVRRRLSSAARRAARVASTPEGDVRSGRHPEPRPPLSAIF